MEKIPVFSTYEAVRDKHVEIDGVVYTVHPLGSAEYLQILDGRDKLAKLSEKADSKTICKIQDDIFDMVSNVFEPNDDFRTWADDTKRKSDYVYRSVMNQLLEIVIPKVRLNDREA